MLKLMFAGILLRNFEKYFQIDNFIDRCYSDVTYTPHDGKVNSEQEACAKYFAAHILKFELLQTT